MRPIEEGLIYHVIRRGNNRQDVFHNEGDFKAFLQAITDLKQRRPFEFYGYCLLNNHFHLLRRPRGTPISRIMQSLLVSHTQRYHKHHRSGGHVRQGRFKSPVIQNDEHLLTVSRYIEANPLRARLVERIEEQTLAAIRRCSATGLPDGDDRWVDHLARRLGLDLAIRPRGRPRKTAQVG